VGHITERVAFGRGAPFAGGGCYGFTQLAVELAAQVLEECRRYQDGGEAAGLQRIKAEGGVSGLGKLALQDGRHVCAAGRFQRPQGVAEFVLRTGRVGGDAECAVIQAELQTAGQLVPLRRFQPPQAGIFAEGEGLL